MATRPRPKRRTADVLRDALVPVLLVVAFAALAASGVVSVIAITNLKRIDATQKRANVQLRNACETGNVVRVELHLSAPRIGGVAFLRERRTRLPITDCGPVLHGDDRVPLTFKQQARFERFYKRNNGRVPQITAGKVVGRVNERVRPSAG